MLKPWFLFVLMLFGYTLQAQNIYLGSGFKVSRLALQWGNYPHYSNSTSIDLNLFIEARLGKHFSLKPGIYFPHRQKCTFVYQGSSVGIIADYSYTNFEIPVLLSFTTPVSFLKRKIHIDFGPYFGRSYNESSFFKHVTSMRFNKSDYGLNLVAGIGGGKGRFQVQLNTYFLYSLSDRVIYSSNDKFIRNIRGTVFGLNLTGIIDLKRQKEAVKTSG
jgi:hypothetical protein